MAGVQNKKKQPGAWNSCLQPYMEEIFDLYFKQKKSVYFIQKYLLENKQLDVSHSTVWKFITVRKSRKLPRRKDAHRITKTALANLRAVTAEAAPAQEPEKTPEETPMLPVKADPGTVTRKPYDRFEGMTPAEKKDAIKALEELEKISKMSGGEYYDWLHEKSLKNQDDAPDKGQP